LDLTPYLPKKFCRCATQSGIAVVLMLAWVMITSPGAADKSPVTTKNARITTRTLMRRFMEIPSDLPEYNFIHFGRAT
jgi:hypothetical protein